MALLPGEATAQLLTAAEIPTPLAESPLTSQLVPVGGGGRPCALSQFCVSELTLQGGAMPTLSSAEFVPDTTDAGCAHE